MLMHDHDQAVGNRTTRPARYGEWRLPYEPAVARQTSWRVLSEITHYRSCHRDHYQCIPDIRSRHTSPLMDDPTCLFSVENKGHLTTGESGHKWIRRLFWPFPGQANSHALNLAHRNALALIANVPTPTRASRFKRLAGQVEDIQF
jgi:hypothetical protein